MYEGKKEKKQTFTPGLDSISKLSPGPGIAVW